MFEPSVRVGTHDCRVPGRLGEMSLVQHAEHESSDPK